MSAHFSDMRFGQRVKAIGVLRVACDAIDYPHRFDALRLRTQLLIASNRFLDACHDLDKLSPMKTDDPSIQLLEGARVVEIRAGA